MLIAIYHILKNGSRFVDLGEDFYARFNREKKISHHLKQLTKLGGLPNAAEAALAYFFLGLNTVGYLCAFFGWLRNFS
jgi:hypothetical protein